MFKGYDFVFDGKSSESEGLKLLSIDGTAIEFNTGIINRTVNKFKSLNSAKWRISRVSNDEPLSFPIQILFHGDGEEDYNKLNPTIDRNRLSIINHWLFSNTEYKKLRIVCDELRDMYFMAIITGGDYLYNGDEIAGFRATVECDTIGCYEDHIVSKVSSGVNVFTLNILQDGIYEVAPVYEITPDGSAISVSVNEKDIDLIGVTPASTITIDTDTYIVTSSEGDELYRNNRFSKEFPKLKWGRNYIVINGTGKVKIKYSIIKEVGC